MHWKPKAQGTKANDPTREERPTPALSTSSVMVTLLRADGRWLISGFNPV
jgi:hypothetical protein